MDSRVLIVDDNSTNRKLLKAIVEKQTPYDSVMAEDGKQAVEIVKHSVDNPEEKIDLILLDIEMPEMDGYEVAQELKSSELTSKIPIIFITAKGELNDVLKGFDVGGVDYITKPFNAKILLSRLNTHMNLKALTDNLEMEVASRTKELESLNFVMISTLENVNSYNDTDTGEHIKRVCCYSKALAESIDLSKNKIEQIFRYASLHDVGKVGIPDEILKKKGKLTVEEYEIMKNHCDIGYKIIDYPEMPEIAKNIVLYHHERWNGKGYPKGLKESEIPIEARIVSIADVYDALRSKRPYKEPYSEEKSYEIITSSMGERFDPELVDKFKHIRGIFNDIFKKYHSS